jgi:hypothetical protein
MNKTRFDLEQAIMQCWSTCDDLMLFAQAYQDYEEEMTEDDVANTILGLHYIHEMRCKKLLELHRQFFEIDNYRKSK